MLYVITGPPAAGKSTWVRENAKHGDITIDYDAIAATLTPTNGESHTYPDHIRSVAHAARWAAIDKAVQLSMLRDVYIIHTTPSDKQMAKYHRANAEIVTIDPGQDIVMERCKQQRPTHMLQAAQDWYAQQAYTPLA